MGFYLVNIGFISLALRFGAPPETAAGAIIYLSTKMGIAMLILGFIHLFNMKMIGKLGALIARHLRKTAAPIPEAARAEA